MRKLMDLIHTIILVGVFVLLMVFRLQFIAVFGKVIFYIGAILLAAYMLFRIILFISWWVER